MGKFIKCYALEIYSVISLIMLVCAAMIDTLSVVQKFVVVSTALFILHEWEENSYPGGFIDIFSRALQFQVSDDLKRASRIPTSVFLIAMSVMSFVWDDMPIFTMALATFCIFEGVVHIMGIKIFQLKKFYTPGMVTAELELVIGVGLIVYLVKNDLGAWYDYTFGPLLFVVCFMIMQKTLTMMIGIRYRDLPKMMKQNLKKLREMSSKE